MERDNSPIDRHSGFSDSGRLNLAEFEDLDDFVVGLTLEQRVMLAQKLLGEDSSLTVVLNQNVMLKNTYALQLNSDAEVISEKLKEVPPETIAALLDAIAKRITRDASTKAGN